MAAMARATRKQNVIEYALVLPLAILVVGAVAIWALVIDRRVPFDLTDGRITPSAVRQLETFETNYKRTMLRSGDFEATCNREIVDSIGTIHRIDMPKASTDPGAFNPRIVQVPVSASWGPATWRVSCCYVMTGLSLTRLFPACIKRPELKFHILPPK